MPDIKSAPERDTLTLEELAMRIGISMTVAYELANRDRLPIPVIRVGRRFLFSRHAYEALMKAQHDVPANHDAASG